MRYECRLNFSNVHAAFGFGKFVAVRTCSCTSSGSLGSERQLSVASFFITATTKALRQSCDYRGWPRQLGYLGRASGNRLWRKPLVPNGTPIAELSVPPGPCEREKSRHGVCHRGAFSWIKSGGTYARTLGATIGFRASSRPGSWAGVLVRASADRGPSQGLRA